MDGAPSLREQMMAYVKSAQERGVELTAEQKAMIAEFEADDELLDQTGRVDFTKGKGYPEPPAQAEPPAQSTGLATTAPAPMAVAAADVDPATVRLWSLQQHEANEACRLLRKQADGQGLDELELWSLRKMLSSLVCTLSG